MQLELAHVLLSVTYLLSSANIKNDQILIKELELKIQFVDEGVVLGLTFGISVGEEAVPWHFAAQWQRQKIVSGLDVDDAVEILLSGWPQDPFGKESELILDSVFDTESHLNGTNCLILYTVPVFYYKIKWQRRKKKNNNTLTL